MKLYAIRHVATKELMPETHGHYTKWEPTAKLDRWGDPKKELPPRMFLSRRTAVLAAAAWVRGIYKTAIESASEGWESPNSNYDYQTEPQLHSPAIPRNKGDLVVVGFNLFEDVKL
jgi:hypothetical protein